MENSFLLKEKKKEKLQYNLLITIFRQCFLENFHLRVLLHRNFLCRSFTFLKQKSKNEYQSTNFACSIINQFVLNLFLRDFFSLNILFLVYRIYNFYMFSLKLFHSLQSDKNEGICSSVWNFLKTNFVR